MKKNNNNLIRVLLAAYIITILYYATAYHYINSILNGRSYVFLFVPVVALLLSWASASKHWLKIQLVLAILFTLILSINLVR